MDKLIFWLFVNGGAASAAWGITDTLAGSPVTGLAGIVGAIVLWAGAMVMAD